MLVPVLVFLFLSMFGENKFSLRTYYPLRVDSTAVQGVWQYDTAYHKVPAFQLTSQTGKTFSSQDLQGTIYVAHFLSSTCVEPCKQVLTQLSRVHDAFRFKPEVKILSFTHTPSQDAALQQLSATLKADANRWLFLTGSPDQLQHLAQQGFRQPTLALVGTQTDAFSSETLLLIDREGHVRGMYQGTDASEVERLITELNILLSMYEQDHAN